MDWLDILAGAALALLVVKITPPGWWLNHPTRWTQRGRAKTRRELRGRVGGR